MTPPTYLVLGSTGGIGGVLCERLAKGGASLVLGGRDPEKLNELAARTPRRGLPPREGSGVSAQSQPVGIVGAGVSGLCCALHLQERGFEVLLLESDAEVGGRVRTDRGDGFLLDRGFQVLPTAYPEAQDVLDLDALRLGSFAPGAIVRTGSRFARVVDPFRRPGDALRTLFSGLATRLDGLRIARLRRPCSSVATTAISHRSRERWLPNAARPWRSPKRWDDDTGDSRIRSPTEVHRGETSCPKDPDPAKETR